ncbi:MAG TPA: hypothetical protein DDX29_02420 [Clostridiales bacterium]|nr:hypothetical protein [Clostridiales bacterium]
MCSPIINPRVFSNEYYSFIIDVGCEFYDHINPSGIKVYQTVMVNLPDLSEKTQVLSIASIISRTKASCLYLIFKSETPPRRELNETSEISGAMLLINTLEKSGIRVLVGFCSSDVVLWKEAGASNCASGKFFNLRRFTSSRWNPDEENGGGQLPYWFEESLMAFLREPDFIRTQRAGILSEASQNNPYLMEINEKLGIGTPWLGLSWRQYLWWFQNIESRLSTKVVYAFDLLKTADMNWSIVDKQRIIFDERRNDGSWIRPWLRAITE